MCSLFSLLIHAFSFFALPYFDIDLTKLPLYKKRSNPILDSNLGDCLCVRKAYPSLSLFFSLFNLKSLFKVLPKAEKGIGKGGKPWKGEIFLQFQFHQVKMSFCWPKTSSTEMF